MALEQQPPKMSESVGNHMVVGKKRNDASRIRTCALEEEQIIMHKGQEILICRRNHLAIAPCVVNVGKRIQGAVDLSVDITITLHVLNSKM